MASSIFRRLMEARGIFEEFLYPKYEKSVDPFLLPDMSAAVERTKKAVERGEKVLIYGDYDVDGVTATTVMYDALKLAGIKEIEVMLPNRFTDGYGMSTKIVQRVLENCIKLVFTVDCGSRNHEIIEELLSHGVETVVTDHHEVGETLPKAVAIVNPKREARGAEVLAGVGVAFKFAQALVKAGMIPEGQEKWLLDLVAIGTICDAMRLTGENRRLCYYGMKVLAKTRRAGLKELLRTSGVRRLDGEAIGYQIGPRLNAAGRMKGAETALELLMAASGPEAARRAQELEQLNAERKSQQTRATREIEARGVSEDSVIVEQGDWHEGVLGIIAGRLVEQYHRPAFVLAPCESGLLKGSGRSFGDFSLAGALDACREVIIGGGGHREACGLQLKPERLEEFRAAVNEYYQGLKLENQERFFAAKEDLIIEDISELSLELLQELRALEPYGEGNEEPVFLLPEMRIMEASALGADGQHLRLYIWDKNEHGMKLMKFYATENELKIRGGETANIWVKLAENEFRGLRSVEGRIERIEVL